MSKHHLLGQVLGQAARRWRKRALAPYAWLALAVVAAMAAAHQFLPLPPWAMAVAGACVVLAVLLDRCWRLPPAALCARLDARFPQLEDSCHLLLENPQSLTPLAQLQRQRTERALQALLEQGELKQFGPRRVRSPLLNATGACIGLLVFFTVKQLGTGSVAQVQQDAIVDAHVTQQSTAAIIEASARIEPPSYTGLPAYLSNLEIEAPEQSRVTWDVTLNAPADRLQMLAAEEVFDFTPVDSLPSSRWQLTRVLSATDFYQLSLVPTTAVPTAAATETTQPVLLPDLHNIEVKADRPPEFSFDYPRDNVTVLDVQGRAQSALLQVSVAVQDDFAITKTDLLLTLASGSGENVRFRNERIKLEPQRAQGTQKHYRFSIPVERYEIEPGDELYWYLEARDNRQPQANVQKSQNFILRWPQEEIFGLSDTEGMAIKVLPEYFRSQRQLIIDTEALLADQQTITEREFRKRSESLAYEQNLLRMRYGRFLGEEDSTMEHGGDAQGEDHDGEEHGQEGHGDHQEEHTTNQQFGDASGVIAAVGHAHDSSDHATLFDPKTKELLRSALNAMWSAWRDLSVVEPQASLPYQHTALRYIKEVQQASRIYLQRVGFEMPPLDESRRLSGEHDKKTPPPVDSQRDDVERAQLLALLERVQNIEAIDEQAEAALRQLPAVRDDTNTQIALAKNLRRYQQQPDCVDCRQQLSALLYALLPSPSARPALPHAKPAVGAFSEWMQINAETTP
ncbi:hypothetical protein [Microbulbifer pacificus]|uniref:DUF4175 domain-containing protein n=1 Tax=Microbulbifer pacificus TaxID=407164 RepID=A0AAU0MTV1_9GAMM|nr:hypothetical protein [Microbulbifer pacificus]WOX03907.1 hypothetical protein R5R33_09145 [Microbulbifer pacificus]